MEVDHDGDGIAEFTSDFVSDAESIAYDPRSVDAAFADTLGATTIHYRHQHTSANNTVTSTGNWQTFDFELYELPTSALSVSGLGIANDTGADSSDNITSDPTIRGTVKYGAGLTVEIDTGGDKIADAVVVSADDGTFSYTPTDLPYGDATINVRIREWSDVENTTLYSDWQTTTFVHASDVSVSGSSSITDGDTYTLTLDPQGLDITEWTIDWGDGTTETVDGNTTEITHDYDGVGNYDISMTGTDADGNVFSAQPVAMIVGHNPDEPILCNGSFEYPEVETDEGWDIFYHVPCWYVTNGGPLDAIEIHHGVAGGASEGDQHVELDADKNGPPSRWDESENDNRQPLANESASIGIEQTIDVIPGQTYLLTFDFRNRGPDTDNILGFSISGTDSGTPESVVWQPEDREPMEVDVPIKWKSEDYGSSWQNFSYVFTAAAESVTIGFSDEGDNNTNTTGTLLDNVSITHLSFDLDVDTISNNTVSGRLPDAVEELEGAWIPVNNDDDDHNNKPDVEQGPSEVGSLENDLLYLHVHISRSLLERGVLSLNFPDHVKVFEKINDTLYWPVQSGAPLNSIDYEHLYVEGSSKGSGLIKLEWRHNITNDLLEDQVRVSVFDWGGSQNVPDSSINTYWADGGRVGAGKSKWIRAHEGTIVGGFENIASGIDETDVLWGKDPTLGKVVYQAHPLYTWNRQVYVRCCWFHGQSSL